MRKVSLTIIMPVYNVHQYIVKCLDSFIFSLSSRDKLIIIDDCSTDDTVQVIEEYIKKNHLQNIDFIKQKINGGAGKAKNCALAMVESDYVAFIDGDDYVDKDYFTNMLNMAEKFQSDIVVSDIALTYATSEIKNNIYCNNLFSSLDDKNINISKELVFGNWACASACNKLFRHSLIKDICFSEKKSDDILFTIKGLLKAKNITYCRNNYYHYYQSPNSLTRIKDYIKYEDSIKTLDDAINLLVANNLNWAKIYSANAYLPTICYALCEINIDDVNKFIDLLKEKFKNSLFARDIIIKNKYLKRNALYNSRFYRKILKLIYRRNFNQLEQTVKKTENLPSKYLKPLSKYKITEWKPLITIVIPVYNGENYLREAIDSALAQTYEHKEIIVVNDGSKDSTDSICLSYGNKIRYFKKANGGVASALNLAIKEMKGEYLSWLSHDDLYYPDKIEKQVRFLGNESNKKVVLFSNYILINENGRKIGEPVILDGKMIAKKQEYCLLRGCVNGITMLIPKIAFDSWGKFDEKLRCTQDYDMWQRMIKKFKFVHLNDIVAKTRIHSGQDTNVSPNMVIEGERLWDAMINELTDDRKIQLEGSVYNYYYKMAVHLKNSPYVETYNMCVKKCKKIDKKRYNKKPVLDISEKGYLSKVVYCLKNYGVFQTSRLVFKKLKEICGISGKN